MNRQTQQYVTLQISHQELDRLVVRLRDRLLQEFWAEIPEGAERESIKASLEHSIFSAIKAGSSAQV